jgi:hypothetical protein
MISTPRRRVVGSVFEHWRGAAAGLVAAALASAPMAGAPPQIEQLRAAEPGWGVLVFTSPPCRAWRIWESEDLQTWHAGPELPNPLPGEETRTWHPVALAGPCRFYRVQLLP